MLNTAVQGIFSERFQLCLIMSFHFAKVQLFKNYFDDTTKIFCKKRSFERKVITFSTDYDLIIENNFAIFSLPASAIKKITIIMIYNHQKLQLRKYLN